MAAPSPTSASGNHMLEQRTAAEGGFLHLPLPVEERCRSTMRRIAPAAGSNNRWVIFAGVEYNACRATGAGVHLTCSARARSSPVLSASTAPNLVGMGVIPFTFEDGTMEDARPGGRRAGDDRGPETIKPRQKMTAKVTSPTVRLKRRAEAASIRST